MPRRCEMDILVFLALRSLWAHPFLLFLIPPMPLPYFNIQTNSAVSTEIIPVRPPVIATARSAREQTNPTTRPMTRETSSAAESIQKKADLFSSCPIRSAVREGQLNMSAGYWSPKEADDCRSQERWNAAVSSAEGVREETMTSSGCWLGRASRSANRN